MTLNKAKKIVRLKALPRIAKYFKEDMKKFLNTQKFIRENDDSSIEFTVDYTQSEEILPFLRRWIPNMVILSPEKYKNDLENALKVINEE